MLACNCLNVIIEPEFDDFRKIDVDSLDLTEFESKDDFFKQELQKTAKLNKTTKKIPALVVTRLVGAEWLVHHCINCNIHTHAINRNSRAGYVLVSCKLLNNEAITDIKNSEQYSSIFDIKIMELCSTDEFGKVQSDSDAIINSLRQRVNEVINRETVAVEENIKKYTEDQYNALSDYRDRVFKEHHILKMRILESKLNAGVFDNDSTTNIDSNLPESNLRSTITSQKLNVPDDSNRTNTNSTVSMTMSSPIINSKSPQNKKTNFTRSFSHRDHSFDTEEILFPLEGMEDELTLEHSDNEDSDQEEYSASNNPESVMQHQQQQQRQRQHSSPAQQLAKSLPVNIPVFMTAHQSHFNEDNDEELPAESMDIAASIKALAKSIQGRTVFGELPRPRFSSQI